MVTALIAIKFGLEQIVSLQHLNFYYLIVGVLLFLRPRILLLNMNQMD